MKKRRKGRIGALLLSVLLVVSILPTNTFAASNTTVKDLVNYGTGSTLSNGYIYRVDRNLTYNAGTNASAFYVASGATVVIDIPTGYTLTVNGGAGSAQNGGRAGIYLPSNSTLIITGGGRLVATGGRGGASCGGSAGGSAYITSSWYYKGGDGGFGGYGAGGGGAAIGTNGGSGGSGGSRGYMSEAYCPDGGGNNANAVSGSSGGTGGSSASSGTLYVLGNVSLVVSAGSGNSASGGGGCGSYANRKGARYWTAGGGSGGGGGGAGYAANAIGSGGPGGGGGGGGASGGRWSYTSGYLYDAGYGGFGGYPNGGTGSTPYANYRAGSYAAGGSSGNYGSTGYVYKTSAASISGNGYNGTVNTHTAVSSTITFDRQNGSGGTSSLTVNYGCAMGNITIPTLSQYTFMGYYSGTNGSGTRYFDHRGVALTPYYGTSGTTLYAYWVQTQFNVSLNAQGGTGGQASIITTGTDGTLPNLSSLPTREHFTFGGYYYGAAGAGTQYYDESGVSKGNKITTNTSIYAKWTQSQYALTFHQAGGTGGTASSWTTGNDGTLPSITKPSKTGYIFKGYFSEGYGNGTKYYNEDGSATAQKVTDSSGKTLYASWQSATYAITYKGLEGATNGENNPENFIYGNEVIIKNPAKDGYVFAGWTVNDSTQRYKDFKITAGDAQYAKDITLHAIWMKATETTVDTSVTGVATNADEINAALSQVFDYIVTDGTKGVTAEDMSGDKSVKLTLKVTRSENKSDEEQIAGMAQGTARIFYDIKVQKQVTTVGDEANPVVTNLTEIPVPVTIRIRAAGELANKSAYAVYRVHDSQAEKLPVSAEASGEYYDVENNEIVISTRKFSVYSLVASETQLTNDGGHMTDFAGRQDIDVQGRMVEQEPDKVYKLDVTWGAMKFEYSLNQEWDADTHMYTEGALNDWRPAGYEDGNNRVQVLNHSNGDVRVNMAVQSGLEGVGMGLHIYNEKTAEPAQYFLLDAAPEGSETKDLKPCAAYLYLDGPPTASWIAANKDAFQKVGVITVTAEAYPNN